MAKVILIVVLTIICIVSVYVYFSNQSQQRIQETGNEALISTIALSTAIVSFLADIVTFITKILEMKHKKRKSKGGAKA